MSAEKHFLTVGGIHAFERKDRCELRGAETPAAVRDLHWEGALVLQADREGTAAGICGKQKLQLQVLMPARMTIAPVVGNAGEVPVGERFQVRAHLVDHSGRELEVGKYTKIDWRCTGVVALAPDKSAAEFGFCDTCFGMQAVRAGAAGTGTIEAQLGALHATLAVRSMMKGGTETAGQR